MHYRCLGLLQLGFALALLLSLVSLLRRRQGNVLLLRSIFCDLQDSRPLDWTLSSRSVNLLHLLLADLHEVFRVELRLLLGVRGTL